jgi:hypothetical protein
MSRKSRANPSIVLGMVRAVATPLAPDCTERGNDAVDFPEIVIDRCQWSWLRIGRLTGLDFQTIRHPASSGPDHEPGRKADGSCALAVGHAEQAGIHQMPRLDRLEPTSSLYLSNQLSMSSKLWFGPVKPDLAAHITERMRRPLSGKASALERPEWERKADMGKANSKKACGITV